MTTVYIAAAKRTAIGGFGGALKDFAPAELGSAVVKNAVSGIDLDPASVDHVVFGQVMQSCSEDIYISRVIGVNSGLPIATPALTVNRLCGSGMEAVIQAAQLIQLGDADVVIAGGVENMSATPFHAHGVRWGTKMGDMTLVDHMNEGLKDPFGHFLMGVTAENLADKYHITREVQDAYALESHRRASAAIRAGYFKGQITEIEVKKRRETVIFNEDEHVRHNAKIEDFAKLRAVFRKDGTVTAGNASGINDGAAAIILASEEAIRTHGLTPIARFVASGHAGVDPAIMGIGPVPATQRAFKKSGLTLNDIDLIESNEAFAAQACAVSGELGFDPEKVNPNGSGISLGHPVGATGAINTVKLVHELARIEGKYGLATMCIGGGQGISCIWERAN